MTVYIMTWKLTSWSDQISRLRAVLRRGDAHEWIYAIEKGLSGYKHIQARFDVHLTFEELQIFLPGAHLEESHAQYNEWYERKEGKFISSTDTRDTLRMRFMPLKKWQQQALEYAMTQNDRRIDIYIDPEGGKGKSWLAGALWERGIAHTIAGVGTPRQIIADTASALSKDRRPIVIIDIPRAGKWTHELAEAIERIKDGLITDPRYTHNTINIRGIKIIVMTNTSPSRKWLSEDKWSTIHWIEDDMIYTRERERGL